MKKSLDMSRGRNFAVLFLLAVLPTYVAKAQAGSESVSPQAPAAGATEESDAAGEKAAEVNSAEPSTRETPTNSAAETDLASDQEEYEDDGDDDAPPTQKESPSPSKAKAKSKDKAKSAGEVTPADFHAETPQLVRDRLRAVVLGSLGVGAGPSGDFSSDLLGFSTGLEFLISPTSSGSAGGLRWLAAGRYASHTGVGKKRSVDVVVQRFLLGGGLEFLASHQKLRYGLFVEAGLYKVGQAPIRLGGGDERDYGASFALQPSLGWQLAPKIWLVCAADLAPALEYSWYALASGLALVF